MISLSETIVVLYNAGPLDVSWAVNSDKVVAILESFFPAQVSMNQLNLVTFQAIITTYRQVAVL